MTAPGQTAEVSERAAANNPPNWRKVIGIIGGLGPHAHLEFERLILAATDRLLGRPARDQDYPPWVLASIPATVDRSAALLGEGPSPLPQLVECARKLCGDGTTNRADFAVMACNTAHAYLDELRARVEIPIFDMISATLEEAVRQTGSSPRLGILATTGTLKSGVYSKALERFGAGARLISPLDLEAPGLAGPRLQEELVMTPIFGPLIDGERAGGGIKSGNLSGGGAESPAQALRRAVGLLGEAGAELVIMACTEIPLALGRDPVDGIPVIDPMEVAADACVAIAAGRRDVDGGNCNSIRASI